MRRRLFTAAALALGTLVAPLGARAQAKEWDKIRIAIEGAYPPFSEVTPSGELKGFDVDIAKALCEEMKAECVLVAQDWDGIIPALLARKYDAIVASMSITEERKKSVAFTNKYYQTSGRFVARKGADIQLSKDGLRGKRIGVQRATTHDRYATDNYSDVAEVVRYGTQEDANLDLMNGRLDLLLADPVALKLGLLDRPEGKAYEFVGPALTDPRWFGQGAGIAIRKEDTDLRDRLNAAIDAIRADGTWERIRHKWVGDIDLWGAPSG